MIKVEIEISTGWFDPEELEKQRLQALEREIKTAISDAFGLKYSEVNVTKIEIE